MPAYTASERPDNGAWPRPGQKTPRIALEVALRGEVLLQVQSNGNQPSMGGSRYRLV